MIRKMCCSFEDLRTRIVSRNNRIIVFGAGVIGQITTLELIKEMSLLNYLDCYVDNDSNAWGECVYSKEKKFEIKAPDIIKTCNKDTVIFLAVSRFQEILKQLDEMQLSLECYLIPVMLIHNYCSSTSKGAALMAETPMIPKKIHYMWLGGGHIPGNLQKCIDSWKYYCPDYEIVQWNEQNYDIDKHPYMEQAYKARAYGFLPDYARLDILYHEGGLYLDTDVEIKRNLDDMLCQEAFCGVEKWQTLNFGGLSGSVKGHPMIKAFLDAREDVLFLDNYGRENRRTCGFYDTPVAIKAGYCLNGETQCINGMNIYAFDYFHPYDYMSGCFCETIHTHSVHWFNGGWLSDEQREQNDKAKSEYMQLYLKACTFE